MPEAASGWFRHPDHSRGHGSVPAGHPSRQENALDDKRRLLATISILGALTFNLFLCFVNTRILSMSDSHVMLGEMLLLSMAFLAAADRRVGLYLTFFIFSTYMLFLFTLRQETDLKALRDIFIPIAFYFLGSQLRDVRLADKLVVISCMVTLFFGVFEYLLTDTYLSYFNILGYYISKGTISANDTFGMTTGLFASGVRPEPRTLLPFLGQHRVSSVFLEPVSAGNFGVIAYCWALFRTGMHWRKTVIATALAIIVLADARFGFFTCILVTLMVPFYRLVPKVIWLVAPFLLLAILAAYGLVTGTEGGANDIGGRFQVTAALLARLPSAVVLGTAVTDQFTADSGLAYTLTKFGLGGFAALWAVMVFAPLRSERGWVFHSMIIIYLLLLMLISNSFYSIKTAALMWFLLGTADQLDWRSIVPPRMRKVPAA